MLGSAQTGREREREGEREGETARVRREREDSRGSSMSGKRGKAVKERMETLPRRPSSVTTGSDMITKMTARAWF